MTAHRVDALEETWSGIRSLLAEVADHEWVLPTPCSEWTVHDLAAHLGAVESQFQGLPQPVAEPPAAGTGIDDWTAVGVRARRSWSPADVQAEIHRASDAQLTHVRALTDEQWNDRRPGPLGETTEEGLATIRVVDLYFHLLDLRSALGRPLDFDAQPTALDVCMDWAMRVTPWGAAKAVGLPDGIRIRLDLAGPSARSGDLVIEEGRGRIDPARGPADGDRVEGSAPAYLLTIGGRVAVAAATVAAEVAAEVVAEVAAEVVGGVVATGADAKRFIEEFRVFT